MKSKLPPPHQFQAFTLTSDGGKRLKLVSPLGVSLPFVPGESTEYQPPIFQTNALWDTGATASVITRATARALNLAPVNITNMTHANGVSETNVYAVNFYLPNNLMVHTVQVMEMVDADGFGALIGMDVITLGDFSITNVNGVTTMSYRFPSVARIDYVEDANKIKTMGTPSSRLGRNDICPCGSGKKYKNCHGR